MADFTDFVEWCATSDATHAIVDVDGDIVVDESFAIAADEPHDVGSIQKLVTGVLLGRLATSGAIGLDDPINGLIGPGWSKADPGHEAAITVSHLATMTAGLDDDFRTIGAPGTGWYYCNNGYHLLRRSLESRLDDETDAIFRAAVFEPCGMEHSSFRPRIPDDPRSHAGLVSTGRDIARFGRALLAEEPFGIAADVLARIRTPTRPNPSYGRLVWLYGGATAVVTGHPAGQDPQPGRLFGGIALDHPIAGAIPADAFGGTGFGDQRLTVVPSKQAVIVRLGRHAGEPAGSFDRVLWSHLPSEFQRW